MFAKIDKNIVSVIPGVSMSEIGKIENFFNRLQFLRYTIPQGAPYMQYLFEHIFPHTLLERIP